MTTPSTDPIFALYGALRSGTTLVRLILRAHPQIHSEGENDFLLDHLQIATPLVRSSTLYGVGGARSEMIISLCRSLGAHTYLSGSGGSRGRS